jgi:glutathione S-transferase
MPGRTDPIRLWGRRNGFHVRKVIWALQELGLPFELIEAGHGVKPTPDFRSRNPSALAPVIDDAGVVVWESNVVVRYLCAAYSDGELAPSGLARFVAEQWMDWNATTLWPAVRPLNHSGRRGGPELTEGERQARLAELARWLDVLEARLEGAAFLAGERFTMADIPAGVTIDRWRKLRLAGPERPSLVRWHEALAARPAFPTEPD